MLENKLNMGGSKVTREEQYSKLKVKLEKLDEFCKNLNKITLIKIDTEGHEYEVLKGAERIIKKHKPLIIFEHQINDFKNGSSSVINSLNELNYNSFAIIESGPFYFRSLPNSLKLIVFNILGIFFQQYVKMKIVSKVKIDFYPFIIALPDE